tara:strand:+ start:400 stop:1083 length:684 start_codon:yes stop_codon:yes gene_type:complete
MKYLLEMILVAILIVVLYQTPSFLHMHLNTILGKLLLVSAVAYLAMNHGLNAGLLGSFIVIVLLNSSVEGFKEGMDHEGEEEKDEEEEQTEEDNEEGKTEKKVKDDEDDEQADEDEEDDEDEDEDDEQAEQTDDDEQAEQGDDEEDVEQSKEGYSNINRPLMASAINLVDQDRMFKVNALKNNQKSRGLTNGVVNDVKGLLNRVSRLELLQEDLESEMMHPDNLESY